MADPSSEAISDVWTDNPKLETASRDGRVIAGLPGLVKPGEIPVEYVRRPLPFAAAFQAILIVVMFASFVLILQQGSKPLYQIGLPILVLAAFLQIAFGNIPPASGFVKSMGLLLLTWAIMAALIIISINITPNLIQLGQAKR